MAPAGSRAARMCGRCSASPTAARVDRPVRDADAPADVAEPRSAMLARALRRRRRAARRAAGPRRAFTHLVTRMKLVPGAADDAGASPKTSAAAAARLRRASCRSGVLSRAWQMLLKGIEEGRARSRPLAAADMVHRSASPMPRDLPTPDEALQADRRTASPRCRPRRSRAAAPAALGAPASRLRSPRAPRRGHAGAPRRHGRRGSAGWPRAQAVQPAAAAARRAGDPLPALRGSRRLCRPRSATCR